MKVWFIRSLPPISQVPEQEQLLKKHVRKFVVVVQSLGGKRVPGAHALVPREARYGLAVE